MIDKSDNHQGDPIVIVGYSVRLPGAEQGVAALERMLFNGQDAIQDVPNNRFDRTLYFDAEKNVVGKAYTTLGGCVDPDALSQSIDKRIEAIGQFDLAHKHFAEVAATAWESLGQANQSVVAGRCGVFVGHSGGTERGGDLILATLAESVATHLQSTAAWQLLASTEQRLVRQRLIDAIRQGRPNCKQGRQYFQAYSAASLVSQLLELGGPRELIDAACASSLLALQHAMLALRSGQVDAAIVGGATFNSVDNLILFSQSQACSSDGSRPFDADANGLISSEGYVAVVVTRQSIANRLGIATHGIVRDIGISTDGRGKSLWAPRTEGQQLAIQRGYVDGDTLSVEYQEAHATSTQLGDATELQSLAKLMELQPLGQQRSLLVGSVKSNFGHTLEAAGLVGLVKVLIALRRSTIPASIGVEKPTPFFEWDQHRIRLADQNIPWPATNNPRRAAVNAFGIGGINAHAVIEESSSLNAKRVDSATIANSVSMGALAIVGRGVVLAGAKNVSGFAELLGGTTTALRTAPTDRWFNQVGVAASDRPTIFQTPTNVGGYIVDYEFNGQPYRIPPKQIKHSNPAQMMLLDAVDQSRREWGLEKERSTDRQRIGVVIGSVFGGEFSNQLQIGLRLPEIAKHLQAALQDSKLDADDRSQLVSQFIDLLLDKYPALLDETGSFTASTLASRIAKTFDWMGGACAVDGDDASGALALWAASHWLHSGQLDAVVCGIAARSLDLVAFEQLDLRSRLVRSGRRDEIPQDCSRVLPGEGVAVVIIKRLDDAVRDGSTIYGVIDEIDFGMTTPSTAENHTSKPIDHQIISRLGYLIGGHSMVRMIAETIGWESGERSAETITATTEDHFTFTIQTRSLVAPLPASTTDTNNMSALVSGPLAHSVGGELSNQTAPLRTRMISSAPAMLTLRIEAASTAEFEQQLARVPDSLGDFCIPKVFRDDSIYRAAACGHSAAELLSGLDEIRKAWQSNLRIKAFAKHHAMLFDRSIGGDRVAWVFPGQGSQYAAEPALVAEDTHAVDFLNQFDAALIAQGSTPIAHKLADPEKQLGKNIWWTQAWVLAVTATLSDSLRRRGLAPDVVLGHSFGEWSAALHAGVLTLRQAIQFAKVRSEAVAMTVREPGRLLSIRAEPSDIRAVLAKHSAHCEITHFNSRDQVVIAGTTDQIETAKSVLSDAGFAAIVIPVPAAFHTTSMSAAEGLLATALGRESLRPPRCGFLSATTATYLAEPNSIGDVLVSQLTRPVLYEPAVNRLIADGCGLLLEVGPSDVLTRLNESSAKNRSLCMAIDGRHGSHADRLQWIELAVECVAATVLPSPAVRSGIQTPRLEQPPATKVQLTSEVEIIDVTSRARRNSTSATVEPSDNRAIQPVAPPLQTSFAESRPVPTLNGNQIPAVALASTGVSIGKSPHEPAVCKVELARSIESLMVDFVIDQTGYSPDVIDLDADLESELAIDSIKKAQLLGELQEQFELHDVELGRLALSDFTNLRSILDFVVAHHAGEASVEVTSNGDDAHANGRAGDDEYANGRHFGSQKKSLIRNQLRLQVDQAQPAEGDWLDSLAGVEPAAKQAVHSPRWLAGVAAGAGVLTRSLSAQIVAVESEPRAQPQLEAVDNGGKQRLPAALDPDVPAKQTCRFSLTTVARPWRTDMPTVPQFHGPAIVVGNNDYADAIVRGLKQLGVPCHRIAAINSTEVDRQLDELWLQTETPHLFLTSTHDVDAMRELNPDRWSARRDRAIMLPFRICQRWMQRMIDTDRMSQSTLIVLTNGGGQFGFEPTEKLSPESGGIAGLTKAMLIEAWMRGYRETPMKVIEPTAGCDPDAFTQSMLRELAVPTYDQEVVLGKNERAAVRAIYAPLDENVAATQQITRGGVWIVSGGGRGITSFVSLALAEKYELKLVMLGTAPHPHLEPSLREQASADRSAVRREVMQQAQSRGENPIEAWRRMEKAIEIDATLLNARQRGIEVTYYCVDVSNAVAVADVVADVRSQWGPISGVLHGAGAGQDARFDRKRPDKVHQCIAAKVDGCVALYNATRNDPLEWFIGFGSISGRFGANGHTDYSLANDMLAKCVGRVRVDRPDVRCVTFHWHAWGDIGMAAKPEAKLALEMIGMQFMPATEGLAHFFRELECGGDLTEVLITDRNYVRKFFPDNDTDSRDPTLAPLLCLSGQASRFEESYCVTLDPVTDRFLTEHRVGGRPTLPMVVALELMAEAAQVTSQGRHVVVCKNVVAHQAIKFASADAMAVEICPVATMTAEQRWCIQADIRRKDGRLVEAGHTYFEASFETALSSLRRVKVTRPRDQSWEFTAMQYPDETALMYHGESLRGLREIAVSGNQALGKIAAPSLAQLTGEHRSLCGWLFPLAAFDAVLYATAILAYQLMQRPSLPVSFEQIEIGRLPDPGEPLWTHVRVTSSDERGLTVNADLGGLNDDCILKIRGYRLHWLSGQAITSGIS